MNLTTVSQILEFLPNIDSSSEEIITKLGNIIISVSDQVQIILNRNFESQVYHHQEIGNNSSDILLNNYPVKNILYAATGSTEVLKIEYIGDKYPSVTIGQNSESLILCEDSTTSEIPIFSDTTILSLKNYIDLNLGWTCTIPDSKLEKYPAQAISEILYNTSEKSDLSWEFNILMPISKFNLMKITDNGVYKSSRCIHENSKISILYSAGYSATEDLPPGLQQVVAQICAGVYNTSLKSNILKSESVGDYSYTFADGINDMIKLYSSTLYIYRNHSI